jgi:hypothetical protein
VPLPDQRIPKLIVLLHRVSASLLLLPYLILNWLVYVTLYVCIRCHGSSLQPRNSLQQLCLISAHDPQSLLEILQLHLGHLIGL